MSVAAREAMLGRTLVVCMFGVGCVGTSVGGGLGISRTAGRTHAMLTTHGGLDTRGPGAANDHDRAAFFMFSMPIGRSGAGDGYAVGLTLGASYFVGRFGVVSRFSWGALEAGHSTSMFALLQLGVEIEAGAGDWRIREIEPCGGSSRSFRPNVRNHYLIGVLPGIQYSEGGAWSTSLLGTFRWLHEPPC